MCTVGSYGLLKASSPHSQGNPTRFNTFSQTKPHPAPNKQPGTRQHPQRSHLPFLHCMPQILHTTGLFCSKFLLQQARGLVCSLHFTPLACPPRTEQGGYPAPSFPATIPQSYCLSLSRLPLTTSEQHLTHIALTSRRR